MQFLYPLSNIQKTNTRLLYSEQFCLKAEAYLAFLDCWCYAAPPEKSKQPVCVSEVLFIVYMQVLIVSCNPLGQGEDVSAVMKLLPWWAVLRSVTFHVTVCCLFSLLFWSLGISNGKARPEHQSEWILSLKTLHPKCEWCIWVTRKKLNVIMQ